MKQQQFVRPVPLDLSEAVKGPPSHPNCRCTSCIPEPHFPVRSDVLYGVPVLAKPYGVLSMAEGENYTVERARAYMLPQQAVRLVTDEAVAFGELVYGRTVDGGRAPVGVALETVGAGEFVTVRSMLPVDPATGDVKPAAAQTFTEQVLDQIAHATGVPLPELTADAYTPHSVPLDVQFHFEDGLYDALKSASESLLGLDNATVKEVMRQAAAAEEERVRYQMLTGEAPPKGMSAAETKAAVDYYLATGRLPVPAPPAPVPAGITSRPRPALPRHRRAMKLRGKLTPAGEEHGPEDR